MRPGLFNSRTGLHRELRLLISLFLLLPFIIGLTPQEAKVIYQERNCIFDSFNANGSRHFICNPIAETEVLIHYVDEWDSYQRTCYPVDSVPIPPDPISEPEPEPEPNENGCVPIWCDLPLQSCDLPPLTDGHDSCDNHCTKPSPEWPNCIELEPEP